MSYVSRRPLLRETRRISRAGKRVKPRSFSSLGDSDPSDTPPDHQRRSVRYRARFHFVPLGTVLDHDPPLRQLAANPVRLAQNPAARAPPDAPTIAPPPTPTSSGSSTVRSGTMSSTPLIRANAAPRPLRAPPRPSPLRSSSAFARVMNVKSPASAFGAFRSSNSAASTSATACVSRRRPTPAFRPSPSPTARRNRPPAAPR